MSIKQFNSLIKRLDGKNLSKKKKKKYLHKISRIEEKETRYIMIIQELNEQQCINRFGYENITIDELIADDIIYMYDKIDKCDDCGLCWMNEEETNWYMRKIGVF